jgi:hypothetical protein
VPIDPGMSTGWPTSCRSGGRSSAPGGERRVAPLRCTHSCRSRPSTGWARAWRGCGTRRRPGQLASAPVIGRERVTGGLGQHLPVRAREVGGGGQGPEVGASLLGGHRHAGQLRVGHLDAVRAIAPPCADVVGADLVAEPARPAVDHHADLADVEAERPAPWRRRGPPRRPGPRGSGCRSRASRPARPRAGGRGR